ncbi:hypothetical protein EDB19DRAFT_1041566 [Suillus lakei]|nr:hypothetical protein EDB19DRAFT_1041566 [Suillus lakei]
MKSTMEKYSSSPNSGGWSSRLDLCKLQRILRLPNRDDLIVKPLPESSVHRNGRCSHDIAIPYASAIASLLIVYVSIQSPGVAGVVYVTDPRPSAAAHPTATSHTTLSTTRESHTLVIFSIPQSAMDSFSNIIAMLSAEKADNERSPVSSTPVEEESQSSSGGCYCVIA